MRPAAHDHALGRGDIAVVATPGQGDVGLAGDQIVGGIQNLQKSRIFFGLLHGHRFSENGTVLLIQCMVLMFVIDLLQESLPLQNSFRYRTSIFAHCILSFCDERESMCLAIAYYVADEPSQDKSPTIISTRSSFPI